MTRAIGRASIAILTVTLALTGCSRLGAAPVLSTSNPGDAASSAPAATSSPDASASDSSSLDSITQDLDSADDANNQAQSNQQSADQAAATNDG